MNKFLSLFDTKHEQRWQDLMKDQLYTAVLGSIIYLVFEWLYNVWEHRTAITLEDFLYRSGLLLLCVVFYLSDYYYIKYSKPYRKWHFGLDIVFMFCMFYAVKSLGLEFVECKVCSPKVSKVTISDFEQIWVNYSFFTFFILYTIWDFIEFNLSRNGKSSERIYYKEVMCWELLSISFLGINIFIQDKSLLLITLLISTFWFTGIARRKKCHMPCKQLKYLKIK